MNFNAINVVMFGVGAILIYSALKDQSPKEVVSSAFTQSNTGSKPGSAGKAAPKASNGSASSSGNGGGIPTPGGGVIITGGFTEPYPSV